MRDKAHPEVTPDPALVAVRSCGVVPGRNSLSLPVFRTAKRNFTCAADKLGTSVLSLYACQDLSG